MANVSPSELGFDAQRGRPGGARAKPLERGQTMDGGAEIGEPDVAVDEEVHRAN